MAFEKPPLSSLEETTRAEEMLTPQESSQSNERFNRLAEEAEKRNRDRSLFKRFFGKDRISPDDIVREKAKQQQLREIREKIATLDLNVKLREQINSAKEILGEANVYGPIEVSLAFKDSLDPESIPEIPFFKEDLELAKKLGQSLILRIDKTPDGKPVTIQRISEDVAKVGYAETYKDLDFYSNETPRSGWALVNRQFVHQNSASAMPHSWTREGNSYLQQTKEIVSYLRNVVCKDKEMPDEYEEAIQEFAAVEANLQDEIDGVLYAATLRNYKSEYNWKPFISRLANLKINQLTRQTPVEAVYDIALSKNAFLKDDYAATSSFSYKTGDVICIGRSQLSSGISIQYVSPYNISAIDRDYGVILARRS